MARAWLKGRWPLAAAVTVLVAGIWPASLCRAQSAVDDVAKRLARRAVGTAARSVVRIEWDQPSRRRTLVANGTVFGEGGQILTAGMPAEAGTGELHVIDHQDHSWPALWVGFDERTGLTLISVEAAGLLPPAVASRLPRTGDTVFVVRGPIEGDAVKSGTLRGLARTAEVDGQLFGPLFEFAAPLSPGDVGALLTNDQGEMIGIVCGRVSRDAEGAPRRGSNDSVGVAIPVATAQRVVSELSDPGHPRHGYLGVVVEEFADAEKAEVRVVEITVGAPAEQAGLLVGDVIQRVQEQAIGDMEDLVAAMDAFAPGDRVALHVVRSGQDRHFDVVLGALPARHIEALAPPAPAVGPAEKPLLGLEAQDLDVALRRELHLTAERGALVVRIRRNSPAQRVGLSPLDLIVSADGRPVESAADLAAAVLHRGAGQPLKLRWLRGERSLEGEVTLGEAPAGAAAGARDAPKVTPNPAAQQRIRELERRIEELERYIQELEQRLKVQPRPSDQPAPAPPSDAPPAAP